MGTKPSASPSSSRPIASPRRSRPSSSRAAILLAVAAACSSSTAGPPSTAIVVGVESDPLSGAIGWVQVTTTTGGKESTSSVALEALPYEKTVDAPAGGSNATLDVKVSGYPGPLGGMSMPPLLVRTAETQFTPGATRLLRIYLQDTCLLGLPGGPPGAPTCTAPQTCIDGACATDVVAASALTPYTSGWASSLPDICKPADAGSPVVQVGTGQTDYLPLSDGQTVQMEAGPQGGHHIWIATRQRNLSQKGTTITLSSTQPQITRTGTPVAGPQMSFAFTFDPDQGGFCKLYGLRYQVDIDGADYHQFLGQPLDVTVTLRDPSGAVGVGQAHVNIDPTLLCPSTATSCN